jgi:hypothetical protein
MREQVGSPASGGGMTVLIALASRTGVLLASLLSLAACSSVGPREGQTLRGPALLAFYGDVTEVQVPSAVRVGVSFTVSATSFDGGCIARGETDVTVAGLTAEVRPYRYETIEVPSSSPCTSELRIDHNTVPVQFDIPGNGRVRIIGLARPGERPYVVEREVTVVR